MRRTKASAESSRTSTTGGKGQTEGGRNTMVGEAEEVSRPSRLLKEIQHFKTTTCSFLIKKHYSAHQEKATKLTSRLIS